MVGVELEMDSALDVARCVDEIRNLVGEGPAWDAERQRLYRTGINGMSVYRRDADSGRVDTWSFPAPVSAHALTSDPGRLRSPPVCGVLAR